MTRTEDRHRGKFIWGGDGHALHHVCLGRILAPERHEDCEYRLDPIHIYRCQNGFWECMRIHGSRQKSSKLGEMMRTCDQRLRLALDPAHP